MIEVHKFNNVPVVVDTCDLGQIKELRKECDIRMVQLIGEMATLDAMANELRSKPQDFAF